MALDFNQNERRVLDVIWRHQPIARSIIADVAGLTTGSVTRITQMLMDRGLLTETMVNAGARGNQPKPLSIKPSGGHAFGVSFSHSFMDVGLVSLAGQPIALRRTHFESAEPERLREAIDRSIAEITADLAEPVNILGVGIAVPGDFSARQPFIRAHPFFPQLGGVDLAATFAGIGGGAPVWIENDCNAAALGERLHGWGLKFQTFFNVFICHGIGGGVVIDGTLFRGVNGNAGGIHSFFPFGEPRPSGHDLFDVMARERQPIRDFCDLESADVLSVPGIKPWIARAAAQLQTALTRTARLLDPEAIVIGGRLPPLMLEAIAVAIDDVGFCADAPLARPKVLASQIGSQAGVIGAAATALFAVIMGNGERSARDNFIR